MVLIANNIRKAFGTGDSTIEVLRGISLEVRAGERLAITGRNGTGKSTLMRILARDIIQDGGEVQIRTNAKVMFLAQSSSEYTASSLTVLEHIALGGIKMKPSFILPLLTRERKKRVQSLFDSYGIPLSRRLDSFVGNLSGGERQLVAISTLIAGEPDLLLLDEFTTALDPKTTDIVVEIFRTYLNYKKAALIFVSHDQSLVNKFATHRLNLDVA